MRFCNVRVQGGRSKRRVQASEKQQPNSPQILHQKQRLQLCLLHALNNLFQGDATFTHCELHAIARDLYKESKPQGFVGFFSCLFNPHYNIFTGNYDVNVLWRALHKKKADAIWCDERNGATAIDLNNPMLIGFILNHPTETSFDIGKGGHWTALRKIGGVWYELDSYLAEPTPVGEREEVVKDLLDQCFTGGSTVLLVFRIEEQ